MNHLIRKNRHMLNLLAVLVLLLAWTGPVFAEEAVKILPIKPVPGLKKGAPQPVLHSRGVIQWIEGNEMVIGDVQLQILNETAYFLSDGTPAVFAAFKVGQVVGYRLNEKRQIIELWALDIKP